MATMKLNLKELREIRTALQHLGNLPNLPIAYEIAKNLRRVNAVLKEPEELLETLREKQTEKDAEGKPIYFTIDNEGNTVAYDPAKKNINPRANLFTRITNLTKLQEFEEQAKKAEKDEFEVDFHVIKYSKLKPYIEKDGIAANPLVPLLDRILIEEE